MLNTPDGLGVNMTPLWRRRRVVGYWQSISHKRLESFRLSVTYWRTIVVSVQNTALWTGKSNCSFTKLMQFDRDHGRYQFHRGNRESFKGCYSGFTHKQALVNASSIVHKTLQNGEGTVVFNRHSLFRTGQGFSKFCVVHPLQSCGYHLLMLSY